MSLRSFCKACLSVILVGLAVVSVFAQTGTPRPQPRIRLGTPELAKRISPSLVTISTESGQGSGVVIDAAGVIVTNLHVIRGESRAAVKLANGDVYDDVSVVDVDERRDLVLLKIKAFGLTPAPIGNSDDVRVGDRVVVVGSPRGLDLSVSDGLISAIRDNNEGSRLFQTSAAASPGSSGGGMFNDLGDLVGIVSSKLTTGENINFGIPVNYVRGLLGTQARLSLGELAKQYPRLKEDDLAAGILAGLLKSTGLDWTKKGESSWSTDYKGKILQTVTVTVTAIDELALVASVVDLPSTVGDAEALRLLRSSFDVSLVAMYVTDKGKAVAANETELRLLDGPGLKRIVEQVAIGADNAAAILTKPAAVESAAPQAGVAANPLDDLKVASLVRTANAEPKNSLVRVQLGNLYFDSERFDLAIPWYEAALALNGRDVNVSTDLGVSYLYVDKVDQAIAQFERSLAMDSRHLKTWLNMGIAKALVKGDTKGGEAAWQRVIELAPASDEAAKARQGLEALRGVSSISMLQGHARLEFNSKQWAKKDSSAAGPWVLTAFDGDLFLKVVAERAEIPMEKIADFMIANAKGIDPKAKITRQGTRVVDGVRLGVLEYELISDGVPYSYYAHFYSDSSGSIQMIGGCARNLMAGFRSEIEGLIAGFRVQR